MPTFSSLSYQEAAVGTLRRTLESDCLAGAYLVTGPAGVGKASLARVFAQAAACTNPTSNPFDACGRCRSCVRAEAGAQPEIDTVAPHGDETQIWQFRERDHQPEAGARLHHMRYAPVIGRRRVCIVARAESLTEPAANTLLKILEEPQSYALFILVAEHPALLLPTIVSRCQSIRLRRVPVAAIATYLQEHFALEPEHAALVSGYAAGRIGTAVRLGGTAAAIDELKMLLAFAEMLPSATQTRAIKLAERIRKMAGQVSALADAGSPPPVADSDIEGLPARGRIDRRRLAIVLEVLMYFYRELLALACNGTRTSADARRTGALRELSKNGPPEHWADCLDALTLARQRLDTNANVALITESLAIGLLAR